MLPYYPARDGYPSMFEADDDAGSAVAAPELAPAGCTSCCKSTSGAADRERPRSALPKHRYWRNQGETRITKEGAAIPRNSTARSDWVARRRVVS